MCATRDTVLPQSHGTQSIPPVGVPTFCLTDAFVDLAIESGRSHLYNIRDTHIG
jgi:hypothetical protein